MKNIYSVNDQNIPLQHGVSMAKETPKEKAKVKKVMSEFSHGKLHSGSKKGPTVTKPAQAKAIAMSEAGIEKKGKK